MKTRQEFRSKHPYLVYALMGATGGIIGSAVAAILSFLVVLLLIAVSDGGIVSDNDAEAIGYGIGLYCLVMFPIGGALFGGIPGWVIGAVRIAQGRAYTILPPLLGGLVAVVTLTTAIWLVILLL